MMHDMERAGIEIVNLLVDSRPQPSPDIIEFGPVHGAAEKRQKTD
jgi:hypothetical protein